VDDDEEEVVDESTVCNRLHKEGLDDKDEVYDDEVLLLNGK
jgi:hypothetical protein